MFESHSDEVTVLPEGGVRCMHNVECSVSGYDCDGATCPCTSETKNCGKDTHCVTTENKYLTAGNDEQRYCLPYSGGDNLLLEFQTVLVSSEELKRTRGWTA